MTAIGTCSGVLFGLPTTANNATAFACFNSTTGATAQCNVVAGSFAGGISTNSGANAAANSTTWVISGVYENQ